MPRAARFDATAGGLSIAVHSAAGFKAGDDLIIYDVCPGDSIRLARVQFHPAVNHKP